MTWDGDVMIQSAPYPETLKMLVEQTGYKAGWSFRLDTMDRGQGCTGLTLVISVDTVNSYDHDEPIRVNHYMPVPAAAYNKRAWTRWLLEQLLAVDRHEAMEFFTIDGKRPFAPIHAPGADPYTVTELSTDEERRTSFRGVLDDDGTATGRSLRSRLDEAVAALTQVRDMLRIATSSGQAATMIAPAVPSPEAILAVAQQALGG